MRVLVVDDEKDVCTFLATLFEKKGWEAKTAFDGRSALELLEKENFDIVFLDIIMPNMDGGQVLKKIRANPKLKDIPVIFVTSKELNHLEKQELLSQGAQGIYSKPMDPLSAVESAIQLVRKK